MSMSVIKNYEFLEHTIPPANSDLEDNIKHSFEFWHENYSDSKLNYPLIWKKALESDYEIIKKVEMWKKNSNQNVENTLDQFFEMWSYAIRESNFEMAKKSMHDGGGILENATYEQFKMCNETLQMIEKYWKEIQSKNIE